ncbi:TetR/AcrR family transcriptional regulator [Sediminispirochaeta bajacaliforniensis]|uniref:TetR/AcrR family transcriptional regulator n=1 Tax=Sediminispirochaeta bajacaliforniensis TaxID=148 RepID=UPI00035EC175|nr:TetR/AcrR family transcriptional regulator [Sediminispirochaeta bajacaliforniensis]
MKDRKQTEEQILTALDRLFLSKGFTGLGVNAVAKEAGVSKVLIYRYFGGIDELLETWALRNSYWIGGMKRPVPLDDPKQTAQYIFREYIADLREHPVKREILRWFLAERTELGIKVMRKIEQEGLAFTRWLVDQFPHNHTADLEALVALLTTGISYLVLLSDRADVYNGVDLKSQEGWDRIFSVLERIIEDSFT